jgi:hypothetical protein
MDFIHEAQACIKEEGKQVYVIGQINLKEENDLIYQPNFLDDNELGTNAERFFGYPAFAKRAFVYHAETREQAEKIIKCLESGRGYLLHGTPIEFTRAELSATLETTALDLIEKYRELR